MIERGGINEERLFLYDLDFLYGENYVSVRRTNMPNMTDIIARHKARYMLPAFFCRPGMRVLDFPCGSGYGIEIMGSAGILYDGFDYDRVTINYCRQIYYQHPSAKFYVENMEYSFLDKEKYDVIACIEGIEHIESDFQEELICEFHKALKPQGILVISTPEAQESGKSKANPYHHGELTRKDFEGLLGKSFSNIQILSHLETLHNGQVTNCLYGICRKEQPKGDEDEKIAW
jgi:2-polyprenyl-3-methyl-5-hydroxy-6-metoxy-1,4-benzoquinol methylase